MTGQTSSDTGPSVSLVAAVASNGVIGRDGDLPWRLPKDLRHFKRLTVGHTVLMGRRTWDSIGRPLPKRRSIVLSRDPSFVAPGADVAGDFESALALAHGDGPLFVIGGHSLYAAALPTATCLELTRVHAEIDGDVTFPAVDWGRWRLEWSEEHPADDRHAHRFTFERHVRR
ncbi:MAG: dihydrofolate reductase [Acidobacteriota bacterium]